MRTPLKLLLIALPSICYAQPGGKGVFEFLNVPVAARLAALGGINVSLADRDPNFFAANPALGGDTLFGFASVTYQAYVADVGHAFVSYAHPMQGFGALRVGIQHMRYGEIQGYDASGIETNVFNASETALIVAVVHQSGNFRLGASMKPVFSNIAGMHSSALLFDLGGVFIHPQKALSIGLCLKNFGFLLAAPPPDGVITFDIQLGTTFKPEHMPIRFSITAHHLTKRDIHYFDPAFDDEPPRTLAKVLGHVNFGTEILLHRNVNVLVGYNFLHHQALRLERGGGGAGVSLGVSVTTKAAEFSFGRSGYVAGSAGYTFTLAGDLYKLFKSRKAL